MGSLSIILLFLAIFTSAQNITDLDPGNSIRSHVDTNSWVYFSVYVAGHTETLTVTVTTLTAGDPDMYAAKDTQYPNNSAIWSARVYGNDAISLSSSQYLSYPGDYVYVGVYGWRACDFTIVASFESMVTLLEGVPQGGSVPREGTDYFRLDISNPASHGDVTFVATPLSGNVMLYISSTSLPDPHDASSYQWASPYDNSGAPVIVRSDSTYWPQNGTFFIAVYGITDAQYSLTAAGSNTNTILRDDIPVQDHLLTGQSAYYQIDVPQDNCTLRVTVTPFSGDPDLYISTIYPYPSQSNCNRSSTAYGTDEIFFNPAPLATYYIGVYGWRNTTYTLLADIVCDDHVGFIQLINGIPQQGILTQTEERYYKFAVPSDHQDITFTVTKLYGDPDLYVSTCLGNDPHCAAPTPGNSVWNATSFGEDSLLITEDDPFWCTNCEYLVGVVGKTDTSYSLVATTSNHIQLLQAGVPIYQSLRQGQYEYFQIYVDRSLQELTITVQPIGSGDPDVYVSTVNHFPNSSNYQWTGRRWSTDSISIPYTDPDACTMCSYYISVFAFTNTSFTLVATFENIIRLQNGIPQSSAVGVEAIRYFEIQVLEDHDDITITLSSQGDVSLLVNSGNIFPTQTNSTWSVPFYQSVKQLTIYDSDPSACHSSGCYYRIGVVGQSDANFTIMAFTQGAASPCVPLISGVSQIAHVDQNQYMYFCIPVLNTGMDLSIIATPISGDPDLYVSTTNQKPTAANSERSATRFGADTVDYENAPVGTYYIGVYAYSNTTFSILALITDETNPASSVIQLYAGQPQQGAQHKGTYKYYYFNLVQNTSQLVISISPEYGDPDLYINFANATGNNYPTITNSQYRSTSVQNDAVRIDNPVIGRYLIAIYAYSTSGYSITAAQVGTSLITLQNGVSRRDELQTGQYLYYVLPVDSSDEDFTVTITPYSGDPDLFVSTTNQHPNSSDNLWHAQSWRDDSITVGTTDPNFCRCDFYIGVYGFTATSYIITAWYAATQTLQNGAPVNGQVQLHAWVYYKLRVSDLHSDITVTLTPQNGDPDLYISTVQEPTLQSYMWNAVGDATTSTIIIRNTDGNFCSQNCTYWIGVYGVQSSNYTLRATLSDSSTELRNGVPETDSLVAGSYEYFHYQVIQEGSDVSFLVTPITGDPDIYVSNRTEEPNQTNYDYASSRWGTDAVTINSSPATTWYISVFAFTNTTFTIIATETTHNQTLITQLVNGVPQTGFLGNGQYAYYRYVLTQGVDQLTFTLARTIGDPDLYIRNDGQLPSRTFSQWNSSIFGGDIINISPGLPGEYLVAVYGFSATNYTIKVESETSLTTLIDGVAFTYNLMQGTYKYYRFPVDNLDNDLTITVTSLNGDPDLYISDTDSNTRPNATAYTYRAVAYRTDSISIPHQHLHLGNYYISVYSFTNCSYSLLASLTRTPQLQDGSPQSGVVAVEATNYYVFFVSAGHSDVTVTVTPLLGSAYLFISVSGPADPSNYTWRSTLPSGTQSVIIRNTDVHWCENCIYYIGVWGHTNANYTVTVTTSAFVEELQQGVPRQSWVTVNQYQYFRFTLTNSIADLTIVVTPVSGDPDIYVSTLTEQPTSSNYQWRAFTYGADVVDIDYTDPNYIIGTYYIGIYAFQNTSFTILVTVTDLQNANSSGQSQLLIDGVPQIGFLPNPGDQAFYEFYVGDTSIGDITITVTPRYGDPDIYVRNDGIRPTTNNSTWSSRSYGRDSLTIPNSCVNCKYDILIDAWSHTLYSVVLTTEKAIQTLESGIPVVVYLSANQTNLYAIQVDHSSDPLVISATALSGDPDIFVSQFTTHPDSDHYQFKSEKYGSDQIVINSPNITTYYISTLAYTNTSFIVIATNGPILLVNGEPHEDTLSHGETRLYKIIISNPSMMDLFVNLNVELGSPILYVTTNGNSSVGPNNYQWTTADPANTVSQYALSISGLDPNACANCTYYIAVACPAAEQYLCSYSLSVDYADPVVLLTNGRSYSSSVNKTKSKFYRAIVDSVTDINLAATTFQGDIEIYVSTTNPYPDHASHDWSSEGAESTRGDHVAISHDDPKFVIGIYYIGIFGKEDSRFSLTLTTGVTLISAGIPQLVVLGSAGFSQYIFNLNNQPTDVTINIFSTEATSCDAISNQTYNLYISSSNDNNINPGPAEFTWNASVSEGSAFVIRKTDQKYCPFCTYYLTIYGPANRSFTLQLSTEYTPDVLLSQRCVKGYVAEKSWKYYRVFVAQAVNFVVLVESCMGNADVYASQRDYQPTLDHYTWKSALKGGQSDLISVNDAQINNSDFYIGVYGTTASSYRITVWTDSPRPVGPTTSNDELRVEPGWNSVKITFAPAQSDKYPQSKLAYTAYYAPQQSGTVMYSYCGLQSATAVSGPFLYTPDGNLSVVIGGLDSKHFYKFNVIAKDPDQNILVYTPDLGIETTEKQNPGGVDSGLILAVGIPVSIIVLTLILYLIYRNRKLTKELDIEMSDVPKRAVIKAVRGPPSSRPTTRAKKYIRLLDGREEEQPDEDEQIDPSDNMSVN